MLAPLPTPWGHRHGTPCGSALSRYPGPFKGEVTASWPFPGPASHSSGPIVTTDGRVAMALSDRVVFLDAGSLRPIGDADVAHAQLSAAEGDGVLAAGLPESLRIGPDRKSRRIPLAAPWNEYRARFLMDLHDGRTLALGDSMVAVVEPDGRMAKALRFAGSLGPVIGQAALAADGRLFIANAMSWSSEDGLVEYSGHAFEIALPAVEQRWTVGNDVVTRVTGTGFALRLVALPQGALVVEEGALLLSGRGAPLYEENDFEKVKPPVVVDGRQLFHGRGRPLTICRTVLPEASGDSVPEPDEVFRLHDGESLYDLVGAAGNHLYAATSQRVVAFRHDGELVWELVGFSPYQLACGNGCLFALERPLKLSRIG